MTVRVERLPGSAKENVAGVGATGPAPGVASSVADVGDGAGSRMLQPHIYDTLS